MRTARLMVTLAATLAITPTMGCGGDDGSSSANSAGVETTFMSKAEFVSRANAVCRRKKANYDKEITAFLVRVKPGLPEDVVSLRAIKAVLVPITKEQIDAVGRLGTPAEDEEEIETALRAQEQALDDIQETDRLKPGELPTDRFAGATAMLKDYGLSDCVFYP